MMRLPIATLVASLALAASSFLPWLRLGTVGLVGVPDPAGFFVLALGAVGAVLSLAHLLARRDTGQWLVLVGLAGLTTFIVVWRTGPATIADRALAYAQAVALVDNVPVQPAPPVEIGYGVFLGLASALVIMVAAWRGLMQTGDRIDAAVAAVPVAPPQRDPDPD